MAALYFKKYGSACTSFSDPAYCKVNSASHHTVTETKFDYLVTTTKKFSYTANSDDDGLMTFPEQSEGSVSLTNGGGKSIMVIYTGTEGLNRAEKLNGNVEHIPRNFYHLLYYSDGTTEITTKTDWWGLLDDD